MQRLQLTYYITNSVLLFCKQRLRKAAAKFISDINTLEPRRYAQPLDKTSLESVNIHGQGNA